MRSLRGKKFSFLPQLIIWCLSVSSFARFEINKCSPFLNSLHNKESIKMKQKKYLYSEGRKSLLTKNYCAIPIAICSTKM